MTRLEKAKKLINDRLLQLNKIVATTSRMQRGFDANEEAMRLTEIYILLEEFENEEGQRSKELEPVRTSGL